LDELAAAAGGPDETQARGGLTVL